MVHGFRVQMVIPFWLFEKDSESVGRCDLAAEGAKLRVRSATAQACGECSWVGSSEVTKNRVAIVVSIFSSTIPI